MNSGAWTLRAFRWSFAAFILSSSASTFVQARIEGGHAAEFVQVLAGTEIVAALAFLVEPVEKIACALLLLIFGTAATLSFVHGEMPLRFVYFAATALYIVYAHRASLLRSPAA